MLYLRGMPRALVREAKVAAAQRGVTLTRLVADALSSALGASGRAVEEPSLAVDIAWYEANRSRLLARYRGDYVAIADGEVMDHDSDFEALAERVFAKVGARAIFMPRVEAGERVRQLRSPRVSRK